VPTSGFEVRIAGPDGALDERRLGDVLFRGPGLMDGYVGPDIENPVDQGWLRTGDLGYLAEGELFVTGRSKEVIVHQGRNYHPEDIEWAAARAEGVQPGGCVAFASVGAAEGEVVVAVEPSNSADAGDLRSRVRAAVADAVGLIPREILVVSRGAIPHAANGKLRRLAARDAHNRGELR
jgi:acyl-CoA synthetase (AMP-forming)/AMP-acid ligase II